MIKKSTIACEKKVWYFCGTFVVLFHFQRNFSIFEMRIISQRKGIASATADLRQEKVYLKEQNIP